MEIVYDEANLERYIAHATEITEDHPVLVDWFLEDAIEIDVDALYDGTDIYIAASWSTSRRPASTGDSACVLPRSPGTDVQAGSPRPRWPSRRCGVRGLINIQSPWPPMSSTSSRPTWRASRTVPFAPWPPASSWPGAALIGTGVSIAELREVHHLPPATGDGSQPPATALSP
ncbi:hypothetical protein [Arthrobacter sp.]|uniref:hypothetical protein n=1 Tax=Arthrobacter sp. TaxID=1667 RepID=UPI003A919D2D